MGQFPGSRWSGLCAPTTGDMGFDLDPMPLSAAKLNESVKGAWGIQLNPGLTQLSIPQSTQHCLRHVI